MHSSELLKTSVLATLLFACGLTTPFDDFDTSSALPRYAVKGRVEGLEGANIRLLVNGESPGVLTGDGDFVIPAAVGDGRSFEISATDVPIDHPCVLEGARGTIQSADATGVVVRCPSTVSALAALELSGGSLTPAFDPKVRSYSARVRTSFFASATPAMTTITATTASPSARIVLGSVPLVSGQPSAPFALVPGRNPVELTVSPAALEAPSTTYAIAIEGRAHDYLKAPSVRAAAAFGAAIAVSGDTLVVGARLFGGADPPTSAFGAVFVFRRTAAGWLQEAQLSGPATAIGTQFGAAVAISGDTLAVGAPSDSGIDPSNANDPGKSEVYEVERVFPHPRAFEGEASSDPTGLGGDYDVALIKTRERITQVEVMPILPAKRLDDALYIGAELTIAGYGRRVVNQLGVSSEDGLHYVGAMHFVRRSEREFLAGSDTDSDTCPGDSGGPVYVELDGKTWLVGATSRGRDDFETWDCGKGGIYTLLSSYQDWILEHADEADLGDDAWEPESTGPDSEHDDDDGLRSAEQVTCSASPTSRHTGPLAALLLALLTALPLRVRRRAAPVRHARKLTDRGP